ncbi:MAG: CPBP family intramembrane metalloprotease [Clostridia bacterium]|nr:CPBP family intramembrane metalloprotease [Clostridia bacterium]
MIKNNLKLIVFLTVFGLVGGFFTALYTIESLDQAMIDEALAQIGNIDILIAVITMQSLIYAVLLGLIGKIIAEKIGLWRKISFESKPLIYTAIASVIGGMIFILADVFAFGKLIPAVMDSYASKPSVSYIIASITYGGVVEEVMLRLFFMSLIAFVISRLSKDKTVNDTHIIIANIAAALLFAAGHIPATVQMIGISPLIVFRCFLLNGGFGLIFGRMYRKYGIQYAMLTHAGVHIISKLIWILFI